MWSRRTSRRGPCGSRRALALVTVAAALAFAGVALADDNPYRLKPGAGGDSCLQCHTEFGTIMARANVHTPVESGDCSSCHDPHASSHGGLLSESTDAICASCHEDIGADGAMSAHDDVLAGNCTACHDPHASDHANQLVRPGNDLCAGCHQDLDSASKSARFAHVPVRGDCLGCHDPHASTAATSLLVDAQPALCLTCHDPDEEAFGASHGGYPVAGGSCSTCHNPHGSDQRGILWANVHRPVTSDSCGQCHESATGENPLALKRTGVDLCRGCHNDTVNEALATTHIHWPVVDATACINCHSPHASAESALLRAPERTLCFECHADVEARGARSKVSHEPVVSGSCSTCHSPHGANGALLLASGPQRETCGTCHDYNQHSSHPLGDDVIDQRNPNLEVDCDSCHRTHGSPFDALASADTKQDLCVGCHQNVRR